MANLSSFSFNFTFNPTLAPGLRSSSYSPSYYSSSVGRLRLPNQGRGIWTPISVMGKKYRGTVMREQQLSEMIEKKVMEAKQVCGEDEAADECKVAWDEVEEVSQAKAHLRQKLQLQQDPLESFCQDNPETDECRIYED